MLAIHLFGLKMPYWEIWLPLAVGVAAGGLCVALHRLITRRAVLVPPPSSIPLKKTQDFDPFVQGSPSEQRAAHRRGGNPVEVYLAADHNNVPAWRGWVVDRSVGGMCLSVLEEMAPGTLLRVLPLNAPSSTPWTDIEVRSCRPAADGYELGCQFVKQPTWSVLLLFG